MTAIVLAIELLLTAAGWFVYSDAWLPALLGLVVGTFSFFNFGGRQRPWLIPYALAYFSAVFLAWSFPARSIHPGEFYALALQLTWCSVALAALFAARRSVSAADYRLATWMVIVLAMGALVGFFSSAAGGAGPMVSWLTEHGLSPDQAHLVTFIFRKSVHFSYYGTLGICGTFAALQLNYSTLRCAVSGLSLVLFTASFDETRQSTQPGRTGTPYDVMLDMTGALVFVCFALWIRSRKKS